MMVYQVQVYKLYFNKIYFNKINFNKNKNLVIYIYIYIMLDDSILFGGNDLQIIAGSFGGYTCICSCCMCCICLLCLYLFTKGSVNEICSINGNCIDPITVQTNPPK